jgi:hypothetical protein
MAGGRMKLKMIPMLATIMQTTPDKVISVVNNYELFVVDEDGFFSERLNKQLEQRGTLSEAGRKAGLKSAEMRKLKALPPTTVEQPLNDSPTTVQPEEKRIGEDRIQEDRKEEIHTSTGVDSSEFKKRHEDFKKQVFQVGGLIYTKQMLDNFTAGWTEPGKGNNPKMKFEKQKTWSTSLRLKKWAHNNYDKIVCYLTDGEKTIKQKQQALALAMEPLKDKHTKETLNAFYRYWSMPENKPEPQYIRWELEEFWDLSQRLNSWKASPLNKGKEEEKVVYQIPK